MSDIIIRTDGLSKLYKQHRALDNINISLRRGEIYGFIGQNGAGKTTLFRLLTGLSFPTHGTIEIFGETGERRLAAARKRIGSVIERPVLYPSMTARQNLEVLQIGKGVPDKKDIDRTLELVNLTDTGRKKAKDFSLGMKQRLALAGALLCSPDILILDEPTNGLDPVNIVELRLLLKRLCEERGTTILLSSHILSELYQLATQYFIVHQGRIIEELSLPQLDEKCKRAIRIRVNDAALGAAALERDLQTTNFRVLPNQTIMLYEYVEQTERVARVLADSGLAISEISLQGDSLEDYFVRTIGGDVHD